MGRVAATLDTTRRSTAQGESVLRARASRSAFQSPSFAYFQPLLLPRRWLWNPLAASRWPAIVIQDDESPHGQCRCAFSSRPPIRHWSGCSQCRQMAILHTIPRCGTLEKSSVALGDDRGAAKALKAQGVPLGMKPSGVCVAEEVAGEKFWSRNLVWPVVCGVGNLHGNQPHSSEEPRETVPWTASDGGRFPGAKTATVAWC